MAGDRQIRARMSCECRYASDVDLLLGRMGQIDPGRVGESPPETIRDRPRVDVTELRADLEVLELDRDGGPSRR